MTLPLCFVLMPFGIKTDPNGLLIDFDSVYQQLIAPAIREAKLESLRADEEMSGGIIHKPMFERLVLCEYAVADLTTANANVFYELGVRHAVHLVLHEHRLDGSEDEPVAPDPAVKLGDLEALQGVVKFPVRIKCATLSWNTLQQGLDEAAAS